SDRARDERLDVFRGGHVGALEERGAAGLLDQRDRLLAVLDVAVADRDLGSRARERERRLAPDARAAARDQRDLALEVVHLWLPPALRSTRAASAARSRGRHSIRRRFAISHSPLRFTSSSS